MDPRQYYLITPLVYAGAAEHFTYHSDSPIADGAIVKIPLGPRQVLGICTERVDKPDFKTRAVTAVTELPVVPTDLMRLASWISSYYATSPTTVWSAMLPTGLLKARRVVEARPMPPAQGLPDEPLTLEQTNALSQIRRSQHFASLIQGVTGSGKTRLYLELTREAIAENRSVIILVPEITLATQVIAQFEHAFGEAVLSTHSKLTESQRHRIWTQATDAFRNQRPRIVVGPRSCLFMPLHDIGLIVIDECHETSYKQDQHPRYHALPTAAKRAQLTNARLILGSATPGLTELYLARQARIEHVRLEKRANTIPLPQAEIVDLRNKDLLKKSKFITQPLLEAIEGTLEQGRQTLLYLNRRGSASSQLCSDCGHVTTCPTCQLPLTFHADLMKLICHHCNFRRTTPAICPECHGSSLKLLGGGTKRIEAEIEQLFPDARLARLDRDSANLSYVKTVFKQLRQGKLDIIIGTQMIAKGLDLPAIDTVGVISADTMLHLPDYTASERTFQLLSQVSGRAGRGDRAGRILIQTHSPEHPTIIAAATGAYEQFAQNELEERRLLNYPPYAYLLKLTIATSTQAQAIADATTMARSLHAQTGLAVIGPAPAFIERTADKFHWIITVKSKQRSLLSNIARQITSPAWTTDLDPGNLL